MSMTDADIEKYRQQFGGPYPQDRAAYLANAIEAIDYLSADLAASREQVKELQESTRAMLYSSVPREELNAAKRLFAELQAERDALQAELAELRRA
jgi:hypothetical protein